MGSDGADEIMDKIEQAHMRGEHSLGPFAGCGYCAEQTAAATPRESIIGIGGQGLDGTALLGLLSGGGAAAAPPAGTEGKQGKQATIPVYMSGNDGMLGLEDGVPELDELDQAREYAEQAAADLSALAQRGIVVPNERAAVVHSNLAIAHAVIALVSVMTGEEDGPADAGDLVMQPTPPPA